MMTEESNMKEVKVSELQGAALDWAVAKVVDMPFYTQGEDWPGNHMVTDQACRESVIIRALIGTMWIEHCGNTVKWSPSTDWSQGGPLIDKYRPVIVYHEGPDRTPMATMPSTHPAYESGETVLIAACRAIVAAKLGDVVSIPDELVEG